MAAGAVILEMARTVRATSAFFVSFTFTVMVAVPAAFAVAFPESSTEATEVSEEEKLIPLWIRT